jgi:alpha-beta hydrolase superfamily lysophospholipase
LWAAIAPVPRAAAGDRRAGSERAQSARSFHGDADTAVPVDVSRRWTKKLKELGASVEYTEYPGIKHNSWDTAYRNGAIFEQFRKFRRQRFPQRVFTRG